MQKNFLVIIAAGGSGGHIYPGHSLAQAFRKHKPNIEIFFWGNKNGMESSLVPDLGYKILTTRIGRLNSNVSLSERVLTLFQLPFSILKAIYILNQKKPLFVIGMGGHASAPLILAAKICRVKSFLWEPNAYPGLANRKLSKFVDACFVVFDSAKKYLKNSSILTTGFLIREEVEKLNLRRVGELEQSSDISRKKDEKLNESGTKKNILIFGGSQGSQILNSVVSKMILKNKEEIKNYSFIHQTGKEDFLNIKNKYKELSQVKVYSYLHDMPDKMNCADFVICRSGASTLAELAALSLTGIFIPMRSASNNHQQRNAEAIISQGAGVMILERNLSCDSLWSQIKFLTQNSNKLSEMSQNIHSFYKPHVAKDMAEVIFSYLENKKPKV